MRRFLFAIFLTALITMPMLARATSITDDDWEQIQTNYRLWLPTFIAHAQHEGIRPETLDAVFNDMTPLRNVVALDRTQPETRVRFSQYRHMAVDPRVAHGRQLYVEYRDILGPIAKKYGVAPEYIIALWGMETSFGANTGNFNVPQALATLAAEGRRREMFSTELLDALKIIDRGEISAAAMTGSWAGAMGQTQFMPSAYLRDAVDGDGDGRRDIWSRDHLADAFASIANKLAHDGWRDHERWGRAVRLPKHFPARLINIEVSHSIMQWARLGVRCYDGAPLPLSDQTASIVSPGPHGSAGHTGGPIFMVYNNYRTLLRWNNSSYFAASAGLLADAIAGRDEP